MYKMARPLPIEQRKKIVAAYDQGLGTVVEIAKMFAVTTRSVFRYIKLERETGDLTPESIPGRPPILYPPPINVLDLKSENYH